MMKLPPSGLPMPAGMLSLRVYQGVAIGALWAFPYVGFRGLLTVLCAEEDLYKPSLRVYSS